MMTPRYPGGMIMSVDMQGQGSRDIVTRVKAILTTPKTEWPVIAAETTTIADLYKSYVVILAAIDVAVIYFTMQICNVGIEDVAILPKGPLIAFLLVQNGGYLVTFTAGGQTLGKMAAGVRVVPEDSDGPLDLGRAFLRTLMWGVLAVPAGLGFLTALFSHDRRGLHDRFAGTRVVRASA